MTKQVLDTPQKLNQALYRIKCRNAMNGGPVGEIHEDAAWIISQCCAENGMKIEFVLKEIK